jgi:hypothetical protein
MDCRLLIKETTFEIMEQAYIIARLKEMTMPECWMPIAEAHAGEAIDIYEHIRTSLIDKTTDTIWEFIEAVKSIKKNDPAGFISYLTTFYYLCIHLSLSL